MADPYKTKQARSPLDRADSNIPFQDWQRLVTRPAGEEKRLARGFSVADGVGDLRNHTLFRHSFASTRK
jgi:hypothetical protein